MAAATAVWRQRCETVLSQLAGYPVVRPHGGWSLLVDARPLGLTPAELSRRLFDAGRVAATPMDGWGPSGDHYLRLVFANEPASAWPASATGSGGRSGSRRRGTQRRYLVNLTRSCPGPS